MKRFEFEELSRDLDTFVNYIATDNKYNTKILVKAKFDNVNEFSLNIKNYNTDDPIDEIFFIYDLKDVIAVSMGIKENEEI